ncbi:MAG: flagellar basal-body MS-ring/collar protein FliF [Sphingopyxis sp.]
MAGNGELVASTPSLPAARSDAARLTISWTQSIRNFADQPAVRRAMPAMGAVAIIGMVALAWALLSSPAQRPIASNASEEDRAAMSEALQQSGIAYSIDQNSGALMVADNEYYQARMMLASQGLPRGSGSAEDMLGAISMVSSRAVESERLRLAREQDLARTIEAIDAVRSARVHFAEPSRSAFARAGGDTTASIMVALAQGRTLSDAQVRGIVQLVAGSLPNLNPDHITLVDQNGAMLNSADDGGLSAASHGQRAAQEAVQNDYRQSIIALLTPVLGENNFTAEIHVDMDFAQVEATREGYPAEQRSLRSEEGQLSSETASAPIGGIPGALSNQPPPASEVTTQPNPAASSTAGAQQGTGRRSENYARNFALGREISVTHQQSPVVRRVTAAVVVKNNTGARGRSAQEMAALERLVKGAIGFDEARGDSVIVDARAFTSPIETAQSWMDNPWIWVAARNGTAALVCLLLLFFVGRPLLRYTKSLAENAGQAASARQATTHRGAEDERRSLSSISLDLIEANRDFETRTDLIRGFVRQDPARAAVVVRDLIGTEGSGR